jgi:cyclopropane-fatty-acyl-phospholipid synthase
MSARAESIGCHRSRPRPQALDLLAKRILLRKLQQLRHGQLLLMDDGETHAFGARNVALPEPVVVHVHDTRFYGEVAFGGSIGAGEAFMQGYWTTSQLVDLVRLMILNEGVLDGVDGGAAVVTRPLQRTLHALRRNTRAGSRRNISAHYDLGDDFFASFLDATMMYSSAVFRDAQTTLEQAQHQRLEAICRRLELRPGHRVVEIGSGWGGFAMHAARYHGCNVTTTTISQRQYEYTRRRAVAEGVADRVQVLNVDYRELEGRYDRLVSIEMIEAVGRQYYDTFFARCASLLEPEGVMFLQAITIADQRYERAARSVDFIQRFIFPGSCIPSIAALSAAIARSGDLRIVHLQDIGPHYARTLREWRRNFHANAARIRALGHDAAFMRMWEYYLCYCEGGFLERSIGNAQIVLAKPGSRLTVC